MLPHTLPYIFSQLSIVRGYLQRITTSCRQFYKTVILISFFKKIDGNTQ